MDQKVLKKLVVYDKESGVFMWKERDRQFFKTDGSHKGWNTKYAGSVIHNVASKGYLSVFIMGKQYLLHRLAWLYVNGKMPKIIDHINGNRLDNRLCNLREVTSQENHMNMRIASNNSSGVTGVYLNKKRGLWCAQIKTNGSTYHIGSSRSFEEAVEMRKKEEVKLGFHKNHGRR